MSLHSDWRRMGSAFGFSCCETCSFVCVNPFDLTYHMIEAHDPNRLSAAERAVDEAWERNR